MHAAASSRTGSRLKQTPDRRIERRDGIGALNDERQRAAGTLIAVLHRLVGRALDPFLQPAAIHALETREGIAAEGSAPANRRPNVGAEHSRVNAHGGVGLR